MNGSGLLSHPPDPHWLKKLRKGGRPIGAPMPQKRLGLLDKPQGKYTPGALSDAERRLAQRLVAAGLLPVEALGGFSGALSGAEMGAAQGMLAPAMPAGTPMPRLGTHLPPFGGSSAGPMSTRDRALWLLGGTGRR